MQLKINDLFSVCILMTAILYLSCGDKGTEPKPTSAPKLTKAPEVINIQINSATISWETDIEANSIVKYGPESGNYILTETKALEEKEHHVILSQLQSNTVYFFIVESRNSAGNATSDESSFTTKMTFDELHQAAWDNYENHQLTAAKTLFLKMLTIRPNFADAHNGLGWCNAGNEVDSLQLAITYFDAANTYRNNFTEALSGRGFVYLALKQYLHTTVDFKNVIQLSPNFIFQHDKSVTIQDVRLGLAEAGFFRQDYSGAQEQITIIAPDNGLDPDNVATWVVDNIHYNTYQEALLAWIEKLKTTPG